MEYIALKGIVNALIFSVIGVLVLIISYFVIEKLTPENTWKEIVQNKNTALALVFAAFIVGISLIISAAIHG
jgi:putative membrane protein